MPDLSLPWSIAVAGTILLLGLLPLARIARHRDDDSDIEADADAAGVLLYRDHEPAPEELLDVDPPVVPAYLPLPDDETWVTFRGYRVHRVCLAGSLRGHAVRDTCAAHLDKAGVA